MAFLIVSTIFVIHMCILKFIFNKKMTFKIYILSLKVNSKEMYDVSFENNSFSRYMQDSYMSCKSVIKTITF